MGTAGNASEIRTYLHRRPVLYQPLAPHQKRSWREKEDKKEEYFHSALALTTLSDDTRQPESVHCRFPLRKLSAKFSHGLEDPR